MGNWNDIHNEIGEGLRTSAYDMVRRRYLRKLADLTGRNTVAYYSGFLQKASPDTHPLIIINDDDKNGFMATFHGMNFESGLDLIVHSPGGDVAATESIIDYVRSKFGEDIRVIVPQISMSGGTMLALAGRSIVMGSHSNLGPIDPQFGLIPAAALLEEFERAKREVAADPNTALIWQAIIQHYQPALLGKADRAIKWSHEIAFRALTDGMLKGREDAEVVANRIVAFLISHDTHHAHNRHIHRDDLRQIGLTIVDLEDDAELQDAVLSVHHAFMNTLSNTAAVKLIENDRGIALVKQMAIMQQGGMPRPAVPAPRPAPAPQPEQQVTFDLTALLAQLTWRQRVKLALRSLGILR